MKVEIKMEIEMRLEVELVMCNLDEGKWKKITIM